MPAFAKPPLLTVRMMTMMVMNNDHDAYFNNDFDFDNDDEDRGVLVYGCLHLQNLLY